MPPSAPGDYARWVVAARTARRAARSGALWGLVFGLYVASSALGFATTYPTAAARAKLATSLGTNSGLAALLGPARNIGTVAGFTGWRATAVLTIVGAIWGLLLATRMLRGEEDAGRWELYLCGQTTRQHAAAQAMVGLGAGLAGLWGVTAVLTLAVGATSKVGFDIGASLYFSTCLVAGAAMFLALGALLSQLAANRRQASGIGAGLLAAFYLLRMVADSTKGLAWLRWTSPLGWIEELRPLARPAPLAFVPIVALIGLATATALSVAGRRDLGASELPSRDTPPPHTTLLGRPLGLTAREVRPVFIGWVAGMAVFGLVLGLVANAGASAISGSPAVEAALRRLGGHGDGLKSYLGFVFLYVAVIVAVAAAGLVNATRAEEASNRLDNVLVAPVSRSRWLAGRLAAATVVVLAISVVGGLAGWAGIEAQGGGAGIAALVGAGLNIAPPALFVLGAGALAFGVTPRRSTLVAYAVVGWSFLVQLVATIVTSNRLLIDSSVFTHISLAPAAAPNWVGAGCLVGLGALLAGAGVLGFRRRDLAGE